MNKYAVVFEPPTRPEGNWSAYAPDLPGLAAVGDTLEECRRSMVSGIAAHIEALQMRGFPVPSPSVRIEELAAAA